MRYAIYFTPPQNDALTMKASRWLGRDAFSNAEHSDYREYEDMTAEPRRYGFHATLKAPFELSDEFNESDLLAAFKTFADSRQSFEIPALALGSLGPFFALVPGSSHQPLQDFAADTVEYFEPFRAPLSDSDITRRRPQNLTESQRRNLSLWGYPHVMDDFRFHMTLTGPVDDSDRTRVTDILTSEFSEFTDRPLSVAGLGLFVEAERGKDFTVHTWLPLSGAVSTSTTASEKQDASIS